MAKRHPFTNRLISEKSPYLLQHAHNPVDWYPWGEEAFSTARIQNKPIFLSIGYATCHWCHQMEKESFEQVEIATLMNEAFINIKIDREELPEVDNLYMDFAQSLMSGAVGWPLNLVLTPNLQPFFAATYLPPETKQGMMGMREMIFRIQEIWSGDERERILEQAEKIVDIFRESVSTSGHEMLTQEVLDQAIQVIYQIADPLYGGMRGAPKFPIGYQNNFLLHYSMLNNESRTLFLVEKTLDMMHRGGIYDHLGGGFSRYSIDEQWQVPHFEKMIYDNAILAFTYLESWKVARKESYREVVEEIIRYVFQEMTSPEGGFFSAEDSDSEGKEGYFYTWDFHEIQEVLGVEDASLFNDYFDIYPQGNFEGRNILHTPIPLSEFAKSRGFEPPYIKGLLDRMKKQLWEQRNKRVHPLKDDKILTSWNGLMIHALAEAGSALQETAYIEAAEKAIKFIQKNLWIDGVLYHRWREGESSFRGGIDDYAAMIRASLSLFEADCGTKWLHWAMHLAGVLDEQFKVADGAYYQTDGTDENLLLRRCPFPDGAEPSGNALQGENLLRLYQFTFDEGYRSNAEDIFQALKKHIDINPIGHTYHLMNLLRYFNQTAPTIVVALNKKADWQEQLRREIFGTMIPHRAVIWRRETDEELFSLLPWIKQYKPIQEKTTLYVCRQGICEEPLTELKEMVEVIHQL